MDARKCGIFSQLNSAPKIDMNRKLSKLVGVLLFTLGIWLVIQPNVVIAHRGGEPRLVDVEAGDFRLSVWTLPVPLVTGEQNFIVL